MKVDIVPPNAAPSSTAGGSKRTKKRRKADATESASTSVKSEPKKRAKGKGRAGKLEGLMLLPLDILFEARLHHNL
jgi:hypothetical protein